MGGVLESRCVGRVYGAVFAGNIRTVHTTYAAAIRVNRSINISVCGSFETLFVSQL